MEDEFIIAMSINDCLNNLGYQVTVVVTDKQQVIETVKKGRFDLILIDAKPRRKGPDGIDIITEIQSFSAIPVIYLTNIINETLKRKARSTRPVALMSKPLDYKHLKEIVKETLG